MPDGPAFRVKLAEQADQADPAVKPVRRWN